MNKKILVIDDDESILEALSLILEDEGYTIFTTSKGDQTYKKVAACSPDLIILDVLMSGSDGRTICKILKTDDATKTVPILMMSAHPSAKSSVLECGAEAFIAKPFDTEELYKKVAELLSHKN